MTSKQFAAALKGLKLSQSAAAEFLGISVRQCRRMMSGAYPPPVSAAKLLAVMKNGGLDVETVNAIAGTKRRKASAAAA